MWDFRRSSDMRLEIGESVSILLLPFIFPITELERDFPFPARFSFARFDCVNGASYYERNECG